MIKVLVLTGATGSGKTSLSERLAPDLDAEIINADASQLRRGLDIGTAKTPWREADVPHHLFDIIDPLTPFSAADYQARAREEIAATAARGGLPFLVGGSGLYISAAIEDYDFSSPARDPRFAESCAELSDEELMARLAAVSPGVMLESDSHNRRRIIRLLEKAARGEEALRPRTRLYDALVIALHLPREVLRERLDARTAKMIDDGWREEVRALSASGLDVARIPEIGYPEIGQVNDGTRSLDEALAIITRETHHYAKRQETWFKNQLHATFIERDGKEEEVVHDLVSKWLAE